MSSQKVGSIKIPPFDKEKLQSLKEKDDIVHQSSKPIIHGYIKKWSIYSAKIDS